MGYLQQFQTSDSKVLGKLSDSTSLANALLTKPHMERELIMARGDKYQLLAVLTGRFGMKYVDGSDVKPINTNSTSEYNWAIKNEDSQRLVTIASQPSNLGQNGQPFSIAMRDNFLQYGAVANFASGFSARVQGEPVPVDGGYRYTMIALDKTTSLNPVIDTNPGVSRVSYFYNIHPEASYKSNSWIIQNDYFRNHMTTMRKQVDFTGNTANSVVNLSYPGLDGKEGNLWWPQRHQEAYDQLMRELEMMYVEGVSTMDPVSNTSHIKDANGYTVKAGHGLKQFLQYGVNRTFTPGTTDIQWWSNFLTDMFYASPSTQGREYVGIVGPELYVEFNNAMKSYINANNFSNNSELIKKAKGPIGFQSNWAYGVGYEVTELYNLFGTKLTMIPYMAWKNPNIFGHRLHPKTGIPIQAYQGLFLDMSPLKNDIRVSQVFCEKGYELVTKIKNGMIDGPNGSTQTYTGSSVDAVEEHMMTKRMYVNHYPFSSGQIQVAY